MAVVNHLPLTGLPSPEIQAVEIIRNRLRCLGPGPHSLSELRPDEADYLWLSAWAADLCPGRLDLAPWPVGAMVMFLAAEAARREAQEGHVWPVLPQRFQVASTRQRLFTGNDQASPLLRTILQEATERLGLRHAFDLDDTQRWYVSIYLQFGFTRAGIRVNLAEWLSGHLPSRAIQLLLDRQRGSPSFRRLWEALRFFRRDYLTEAQLRQQLRESPWVLPLWVDEIIGRARDRIDELGTTVDDPEREQPPFVERVRLEWEPPGEPQARCRMVDPTLLGLAAPRYHVLYGDEIVATLFRQADGSYHIDCEEIVLPCHESPLSLNLVDAQGRVHTTQLVDIWDSTSEVNLFSAHGIAVDPSEPLAPDRTYIVQIASDCQISPQPACWQRVGGQRGRLWAILADWPKGLRVCDDRGETIWIPRVLGVSPPASWAERVEVVLADPREYVPLGDLAWFTLGQLPPGTEVRYVRLNGQPLIFDPAQGTIAPVRVTPELAAAGWRFRFGLTQHGVTVQAECRPAVPVLGAALFTHKGWQQLSANKFLPLDVLRDAPCRVFLPLELTAGQAALLEGSIFVKPVGAGTQRLGISAGLGDPATLRASAYNCPEPLCQLACGVDFGILAGIECDPIDRQYRLRLHHSIHPAREHSLVCWSPSHGLHKYAADEVQVSDEGRTWSVRRPWPDEPDTVVCAIAYGGVRQGFAWLGKWGRLFSPLAATEAFSVEAQRAAGLIRWYRLPILLPDKYSHGPVFQDFCRKHPAEVLSVWLFDFGLDEELRFGENHEARKAEWAALRQILAGLQPKDFQAQRILDIFSHAAPVDPLEALVKSLLSEDPLLAGRVLQQAWLAKLPTKERAVARQRVRSWRCQTAGLPNVADRDIIYQREDDALKLAAEKMRSQAGFAPDPFFVKAIADRAVGTLRNERLSPPDAENLAVASEEGRFRQYLSLRVLAALEQSI